MMNIETTRFGTVTVADDRVIEFPKGLLGFPARTRFVLLESTDQALVQETKSDCYFWWLQSADQPDLAFVVTDPTLFVKGYTVPMHPEQLAALGMASLNEAQVFVIVNKTDHVLSGNLQGPLVVNVRDRHGEQLVLSDRRYTTRVPLMELGAPSPVVKTTTPAPRAQMAAKGKKASAAVA